MIPVRSKSRGSYRALLFGLSALFAEGVSSRGLAQTEPCDYIAPYTPFVDGAGDSYSRANHSEEIGLYTNGNEMPQGRLDNGAFFANQIAASSSYALVSVGMSNTHREFEEFVALAATHAEQLNSKLSIVDAAIGSVDANDWSGMHTMAATCSPTVDDNINPWLKFKQTLSNAGVAKEEVRAIWLKLAIISPTQSKNGSGGFPSHANVLKDRIGCVARKLQSYLPKLDLIFLSSRTHAGDLSGDADANELNPEPFAYESGFSVRWLIDEQINGDHSDMPFLAWGPYLWANGQDARAYDGFVWTPVDLSHDAIDTRIDCTHPSEATGEPKVACLLWNFFSQHPLATPWFLKPGTTPPVESCASAIDYPDPVDGGTPPPGYDADAGANGSDGTGNANASSNGGGCSISGSAGDSAMMLLWGVFLAVLWKSRRLIA